MSKIRTIERLQSLLDEELSWRIKEIATLKILVKRSDNIASSTAVRAAIPLLYGHWEGFIKSSATYYLQFINGQSLKYSDLTSCFVVFGVKKKLNDIEASMASETSIAAVEFLMNELNNTAKLKVDSAIRTEFNLSSKVFVNILKSIGFGVDRYEARFNLIDESLLKRRNYIAHGEYLDVEADGFRDLADEILCMLRWFKTDIENAASLGLFKKIA
ncbi:MAE_28990/MAE_18760 family HEPN-like nuclease [Microbulbifer thermotolerans]|uniref:MAE_28990/MAE_18760 family HEPN-like nuclease n=1 Tax=Microbulbifer thermotolerans TaxID=252514 RepID=UPI00224A64A0|nr:MAE_28990/MAE_18760 family HEPN-like nuclease [Microbulbifer thermotolerans]MCX2780959.1 MAE_28990/MAE_18760 family HEPN-like nuclease [Microbulbifer thermotolerans]MCX2806579.1 MAE_28990/MAE_18760 family HEPN-like nuclease [Microbulbifer thermotolerans]